MMAELPEPFVPAHVDLRDFRWMKLDLTALFNSDFNATPNDTAWRAGVTLWGKAWHQVPASSLPDDDAMLCNLAGLGRDLRTWGKVKKIALHGFQLCSDGRLYHVFLGKRAIDAYEEWQQHKDRRAKDRDRKNGKSASESEDNSNGIPVENADVSSGKAARKSKLSAGNPQEKPLRGSGAERSVDSEQKDSPGGSGESVTRAPAQPDEPRPPAAADLPNDGLRKLGIEVLALLGADPARHRGGWKPLEDAKAAGFSDAEILAAIRERVAAPGYEPPRNAMGWLGTVLPDLMDRWEAAHRRKPETAAATTPLPAEDIMWVQRLKSLDKGVWLDGWGIRPTLEGPIPAGCQVPPALIAEWRAKHRGEAAA